MEVGEDVKFLGVDPSSAEVEQGSRFMSLLLTNFEGTQSGTPNLEDTALECMDALHIFAA